MRATPLHARVRSRRQAPVVVSEEEAIDEAASVRGMMATTRRRVPAQAPVSASSRSPARAQEGGSKEEEDGVILFQPRMGGVTGMALPTTYASLLLLQEAAVRLGLPRLKTSVASTNTALSAHNQQREFRCVAASMCMGMFLRACLQLHAHEVPSICPVLARECNTPSITYAYHAQRRQECENSQRCDCGPMCGGVCDNCGTRIHVMAEVCRRGVCRAEAWDGAARSKTMVSTANDVAFLSTRPHYRLSACEWIPLSLTSEGIADSLRAQLFMGCPVVMTLLMFTNQQKFRVRLMAPRARKNVFDDQFLLPDGRGRTMAISHAVLIVGMNADGTRLQVRNSDGASWGCHGDFCMRVADVTPRNVGSLLAIQEVQLEDAPAWRKTPSSTMTKTLAQAAAAKTSTLLVQQKKKKEEEEEEEGVAVAAPKTSIWAQKKKRKKSDAVNTTTPPPSWPAAAVDRARRRVAVAAPATIR